MLCVEEVEGRKDGSSSYEETSVVPRHEVTVTGLGCKGRWSWQKVVRVNLRSKQYLPFGGGSEENLKRTSYTLGT